MLSVRDLAPPFSGTDHKGVLLESAALLRQGPVVIYFYPKDFTPGCTKEACLFRDAFEELGDLSATIVGVSVDDAESHQRFAERYRLPFSLLSDPDRKLAKAFGVLRPLGILGARRVTYVIDGAGYIRGAFHHELSMGKHVSEVRACLEQIAREQPAQTAS